MQKRIKKNIVVTHINHNLTCIDRLINVDISCFFFFFLITEMYTVLCIYCFLRGKGFEIFLSFTKEAWDKWKGRLCSWVERLKGMMMLAHQGLAVSFKVVSGYTFGSSILLLIMILEIVSKKQYSMQHSFRAIVKNWKQHKCQLV